MNSIIVEMHLYRSFKKIIIKNVLNYLNTGLKNKKGVANHTTPFFTKPNQKI